MRATFPAGGVQRTVAARAAIAAAAYLVLALWSMRDVFPDPANLLLAPPSSSPIRTLSATDQKMVLAVVTRNARLLSSEPWRLAGAGGCHPTPRAYTLGEHMLGNGLLAALPYRIWGDPILAYNAMLVLGRLIAALSMYALSFHFTRHAGSAFVAGALFAFHPMRIGDTVHPYVNGDLWTPLALLFLHRLFATGRLRDALGFAAFFALGILESLYALLSSTILVMTLGIRVCLLRPRRVAEVAVALGGAAAMIGVTAWLVLGPYLETAATWDVLRRPGSSFASPEDFAPGGRYFPGAIATALTAVALLDRLRGTRGPGEDPRLGFLAAGLLLVWCASYGVRLPLVDVVLLSPLRLLRGVVPGLDAVRVLSATRLGVYLCTAFLAGYGVFALLERLRGRLRVALPAALAVLALAEVSLPALATSSFGWGLEREAQPFAPDAAERALFERGARGAVLDLPYGGGNLAASSHYLLLSAYHGHPLAACYNSFRTPIQDQVERLVVALPDAAALAALAALGFRTIAVHRRFFLPARAAYLEQSFAASGRGKHVRTRKLGEANDVVLYDLAQPAAVRDDLACLAPPAQAPRDGRAVPVGEPRRVDLRFAIENRCWKAFRHPDPIAPSDLVLLWRDPRTGARAETHLRALLPLALAARRRTTLEVASPVPPLPARRAYDVLLALEAEPTRALGRARLLPRDGRATTRRPGASGRAGRPSPTRARPAAR